MVLRLSRRPIRVENRALSYLKPPRSTARAGFSGRCTLGDILAEFGLKGPRSALVGTKTYTSEEVPDPDFPEDSHASMLDLIWAEKADVYNPIAHDVPSYIVDTLRGFAKRPVVNVTQMFIDPSDGFA